MNASDFLNKSVKMLEEKSKLRDQPDGERNMKTTVNLFNELTGNGFSEADGWLFMVLLKITRMQTGSFNEDDYVDLNCYSSLLGECKASVDRERRENDSGLIPPSVGYVHEMGTYSEPGVSETFTTRTGKLA